MHERLHEFNIFLINKPDLLNREMELFEVLTTTYYAGFKVIEKGENADTRRTRT